MLLACPMIIESKLTFKACEVKGKNLRENLHAWKIKATSDKSDKIAKPSKESPIKFDTSLLGPAYAASQRFSLREPIQMIPDHHISIEPVEPCIDESRKGRRDSAQIDLHAQTSLKHAVPPEDFRPFHRSSVRLVLFRFMATIQTHPALPILT